MRFATVFLPTFLTLLQALGTQACDCRMYLKKGRGNVDWADRDIGTSADLKISDGLYIKIWVIELCDYEILRGEIPEGYSIVGREL